MRPRGQWQDTAESACPALTDRQSAIRSSIVRFRPDDRPIAAQSRGQSGGAHLLALAADLEPFGVYRPASSAVGLYQMTDAAHAEASRYCVRRHAVVDADCWSNSLYIRAVPSHAIELAAVYLDRSVAAVLAYAPDMTASPQEKQDLAAFIHLCGGGPARAFVRRGFQVMGASAAVIISSRPISPRSMR